MTSISETGSQTGQLVPVAIPAPEFVAEKVDENSVRTVLPLVGWLVTPEGEVVPLPRSLDASWVIRARVADDDARIAMTAERMRPTNNQQGSSIYWR